MKPLLTVLAIGTSLGLVGIGGYAMTQSPFLGNNFLGLSADSKNAANPRQDYTTINLANLNRELTGSDPKAIALSAFGVGEPQEGRFEETVQVDTQDNRTIVTITQTGLADSSVEAMRYRVELQPEENATTTQWRIVWAGRQFRCQPERGSQDWTTQLCI